MSGAPSFPHLPSESWDAYVRDELDGAARERIEAHADACAECRGVLLAADSSRAFRLLREPAPEGTWDGFWDELQPALAETPARRPNRRLAGALAAAAVLAAMAVLVSREQAVQPQADPCAPSAIAELRLTRALSRAECEALYGSPIEAPQPEIVVIRDLDLRGL